MERIHFHDPDQAHAEACRQNALNHHKDHLLPATDTNVPIGEWALWNREDTAVVIPGMTLPESAMVEMAGSPVSRLISSPMLPEGMLVTGIIDHPTDLVMTIQTPEQQP